VFDRGSFHWVASIPAVLGSSMTLSYILTAAIGFNLPLAYGKPIGMVVAVLGLLALVVAHRRRKSAGYKHGSTPTH
jgi:hypothetical protein